MATLSVSPSKRTATSSVMSTTLSPVRVVLPATPLDYSFMGLATLSDMIQNDPVGGKKKSMAAAATTTTTSESTVSATNNDGSPSKHTQSTQSAVSLRVNNNKLQNLDDLDTALAAVFDDPTRLQWIDLSGNALSRIPAMAFAKYAEIFTLHLHGNRLTKYTDIDHLATYLPNLHALTLHGNPLEEKKHYRSYVISSFPLLKQLDFSSVTKGDREKADTWARIYKKAIQASRAKTGKRGNDDSEYE